MATRTHSGFTLFETTISFVLAVLLISIGVPSLNTIVQNNRLITQTESLINSLQLAKHISIVQRVPVTLCASSDQISCDQISSWNSGWIVFTDEGKRGIVDGSDKIIDTTKQLEHRLSIVVSGENTISYQPAQSRAYVCIDCKKSKSITALNRPATDSKLSNFISNNLPFSDAKASTRSRAPQSDDLNFSSRVNGNTEFSICDDTRSGETGRLVVVSMIGRVSTANKQCD